MVRKFLILFAVVFLFVSVVQAHRDDDDDDIADRLRQLRRQGLLGRRGSLRRGQAGRGQAGRDAPLVKYHVYNIDADDDDDEEYSYGDDNHYYGNYHGNRAANYYNTLAQRRYGLVYPTTYVAPPATPAVINYGNGLYRVYGRLIYDARRQRN